MFFNIYAPLMATCYLLKIAYLIASWLYLELYQKKAQLASCKVLGHNHTYLTVKM